jgi:hypothetical protein
MVSTCCFPAIGQMLLVTEEEARASSAAAPPEKTDDQIELVPRATLNLASPRIEIVYPDVRTPVVSPTRVQLMFRTVTPANIQPATCRALYGTWRVDITKRLLQYAKVTSDGINVDEAALPPGSHRIFLEVQDSDGRIGSQVLSFTVQ